MTQKEASKISCQDPGISANKIKTNNAIKMAGIAVVILLIGIGVFMSQKDNQDVRLKEAVKPEAVKPEAVKPEVVNSEVVNSEVAEPEALMPVKASDTRAVQLQAEIESLLNRLKNVRAEMENSRQHGQLEIQRLTNQLQTPSGAEYELSNALMEAQRQTEHWLAVEALADKVVYQSSTYLQVRVQLGAAVHLIQDKNIQGAVDVLTPVKVSLITMLSQAENAQAVITEGGAVREARENWLILAKQQSWDQLPPALKIEKQYQNTHQDESEGRFVEALSGYRSLLKKYGSLQHAGEALLAAQMPLENAKSGWETFANEYGLNDIPLAKTLDKDYMQYQQTISSGELLAASEKAVSLEKSYSDLLAGGQNISQYRDLALKAKEDWDAYASEQKLTIIPQHKQWADEMAIAELDLKAGMLPKAGTAYKQLAENYSGLLINARLAITSQIRAAKAQLDWNTFAAGNDLDIPEADAAKADLSATVPVMHDGQFEKATKMLLAVAIAYEELLSVAEQALLSMQMAAIAKHDCVSLERAIEKHFCMAANKRYETTLTIWKKGEFAVAKTQFDQLVTEYQRLFIDNGQSTITVAGVSFTLQTIPAGSFQMATVKSGDEKPVHLVNVATFKIMAKEVTFAQYDAYAKATGAKLPNDEGWGRGDRPVVNVNWNDAQGFAAWLSQQTGKKFRLPAEKEWEYAAKASRTTKYSWGDSIDCSHARYNGGENSNCYYKPGNIHNGTLPVGSFSPNPWGLYDMSGNVWEWTKDCVSENDQGAPINVRFWKSSKCSNRITRGGSWSSFPDLVYPVSRDWNDVTIRTHIDGFRLVQEY